MKKIFDCAIVCGDLLMVKNILSVMERRDFPVGRLVLLSEKNEGVSLEFRGKPCPILELNGENVIKNRTDIAIFCTDAVVSKKYAPLFSALSCSVIDSSPAFHLDDNVPLVIPSLNPSAALVGGGIIACPFSTSVIALSALYPLHKKYGIRRIVYTTLQAVSDAGTRGIDELNANGSRLFSAKIAGNILPVIGEVLPTGYSAEEQKLIEETRKILGDQSLCVTATCLRVPTAFGHGISVNVELNYSVSPGDIERVLSEAGLEVAQCPTPLDTEGKSEIFVCRVRRDFSQANTFNLLLVADNILKSALNLVQTAELLI